MESLQKYYALVVSSEKEASVMMVELNKDILAAEFKIEKGTLDVQSINIQYIKTQAKLDTMEKMWKDTVEKLSFTSSSLETVITSLQTLIQQLDSSIVIST